MADNSDEKSSSKCTSNVSMLSKDLEHSSKIFGQNSSDKLSNYQKAINTASFELAKEDDGLLLKRGELFARARQRVEASGYSYAKKTSRSKVFGKNANPSDSRKRPYMQSSEREERITSVTDIIKSHDETMALLQKQKQKFVNVEKFLEADEINKSILEISIQKQEKVKELALLNKAQTRSAEQSKKKFKRCHYTNSLTPTSLMAWIKNDSTEQSISDYNDDCWSTSCINTSTHIKKHSHKSVEK